MQQDQELNEEALTEEERREANRRYWKKKVEDYLNSEEGHIDRAEAIWRGKQEQIWDVDSQIKQAKMERYSGSQNYDSESYYRERDRRRTDG